MNQRAAPNILSGGLSALGQAVKRLLEQTASSSAQK
jgi:hypothetical protein